MLKELFEAMASQAVEAKSLEIIHPDAEPAHKYLIIDRDGMIIDREAAPKPRADKLLTLVDFCAAVIAHKSEATAVYCGGGGAVAVLDDSGNRRDRLTLELPISQPMSTLLSAEGVAPGASRRAYSQKQWVEMLRVSLNGCVEAAIIERFRAVKTVSTRGTASRVQAGRESLDAEVVAEVMCDGIAPPEEIELQVYAYRDLVGPEFRHRVRCAVVSDLQADTGPTFILIPLAGELARVLNETDGYIRSQIEQLTGINKVYCGKPN